MKKLTLSAYGHNRRTVGSRPILPPFRRPAARLLFDQRLTICASGLDRFAPYKDLTFAVAGRHAQVGLRASLRTIDDTPHHGHPQRHRDHPGRRSPAGQGVDVDRATARRRATRSRERTRPQVQRLGEPDCPPDFDRRGRTTPRMVSPMPATATRRRQPRILMVPWKAGPASVTPKCKRVSHRAASSSWWRRPSPLSRCADADLDVTEAILERSLPQRRSSAFGLCHTLHEPFVQNHG